MLLLPVNSYFIVYELDKNKLLSVIFIGILIDLIYGKFLYSLVILVLLYGLFKMIKVSKKYYLFKNIIIYLVFFNIMYFSNGNRLDSYLVLLVSGLVLQVLYIGIRNIINTK